LCMNLKKLTNLKTGQMSSKKYRKKLKRIHLKNLIYQAIIRHESLFISTKQAEIGFSKMGMALRSMTTIYKIQK